MTTAHRPIQVPQVEAKLINEAYLRLRASVFMTVGVTLLFVSLLWPHFPAQSMWLWLAALLGTSVARWCLSRAFGKEVPSPEALPMWRRFFGAGAVAAGLAWAAGPVMMMADASGVGMALLSATLLSVCAVAVNSLAPLPGAMQGFLVVALAPTALAAAANGGTEQRILALVLAAGLLALIVTGRRASQAMRELMQSQVNLDAAVKLADTARDMAQAASLAKSRFLANMSHELRTPLNAVIGAAQLLRAQTYEPERAAHLVDAIQRGGTNLLGLIENILDLSRIEAGEMALHPSDFHLVECIEGALTTAALVAPEKRLKLACVVDADLPAWRHGDAARLRQLVLNLLGNAIKFTERGEVLVRVSAGAVADVVNIQVSDTGVGISPASLPHIFNPFKQADDGADRRFGGSGLGLAIVRQLAQAMGGEVRVSSELGAGSCFELDLPLPAALVLPSEPVALGHRVAFVEPHQPSAEALMAQLDRLGCQAQRCQTAEQLVQWLLGLGHGAEPWVLLALDEMDVTEFIDPIVHLVDPHRLVGMSADVSHEVDSALDGFHLSRQLVKPVTRSALVSRLGQVAEQEVAETLPQALMSEAQVAGMVHVLVVEDDELNRFIVTGMLQHAGCRVSIAGSGQEALDLIGHLARIDMVLLDWQMPGMDGLEVARRLRAGAAGSAGQQVPIVALTANAFAEDRAACLAAGMNDFLTKPVLAARLLAAVQRWTALGRAQPNTKAAPKLASGPPLAAPPPPIAGAPVFDPAVLAALPMVADGTAPGYAQELLAMFLASQTPTIEQLQRAMLANETAVALRLMHTLKSTSASVGALELAELAGAHESALRAGAAPAPDLPRLLRNGFQRLAQAVRDQELQPEAAAPVGS